jgi:outer membrane usher protein
VGYDLGRGNVRIFPPYRSGYLVTAGSDYSITAIGTLLDQTGAPVSLLAGRAVELAAPDRTPVTVFTNRAGRFGLSGLRPGRWRIEMPTEPAQSVIIDVPEKAQGVVRLGEVKLGESK